MSNDNNTEPKLLKRGRKEEETPTLNEADVCRAIKKHELLDQYNLSVDEIKAVLDAYGEVVYRCMLNDIKICIPKLGWFKRKHKKGMSARKMSMPLHPFTEDTSYKMVERPKQPDYSTIEFIIRKKVKDAFKQQTLGEDNSAY